jgi:hypothetical protein
VPDFGDVVNFEVGIAVASQAIDRGIAGGVGKGRGQEEGDNEYVYDENGMH